MKKRRLAKEDIRRLQSHVAFFGTGLKKNSRMWTSAWTSEAEEIVNKSRKSKNQKDERNPAKTQCVEFCETFPKRSVCVTRREKRSDDASKDGDDDDASKDGMLDESSPVPTRDPGLKPVLPNPASSDLAGKTR